MRPYVEEDKCTGCGECRDGCPAEPNVFEMAGGLARVVHPEACVECGLCESNCPTGAITLRD